MDIFKEISSDRFNKAFWLWFDSLDAPNRNKFMYYPNDMAKVYFYNKIWSKNFGQVL